MNWFKKLLGFKDKGTFEVVYSKSGTWNVMGENNALIRNEYCHFDILFNDVTKKYKLEHRGYRPESHLMYPELFKYMRMLNEGLAYHKGGELYTYKESDSDITNGKDISSMNETECQVYLNQALEEEDYELAEKIRKQLEKFK
jgi:protein-arginine kinase activator protein McsA